MTEGMTMLITYCLMGLTAAIILLAAFTHWMAAVLGLLTSFLLPIAVKKKLTPPVFIVGIVGYLAIAAPFVPLILRHPLLAGIPVAIAMLGWLFLCFVIAEETELAEVADLDDGAAWALLLVVLPQFARKCDWAKLHGGQWAFLLSKRPRFADKCDWAKLDGGDWADLLSKQPQFADKCDWAKLEGSHWAALLGAQPQFADKRSR